MNIKRNNLGFTIIELAVVVMITSILASIAVVQFRKFRAKSYTVEAKITLANIHSLEKVFETNSHFYTNCLKYIGFKRFGTTVNFLYAVGFPNTIAAIDTYVYNGADPNFFDSRLCQRDLAPEEDQSYFLSTVIGAQSQNIGGFSSMAPFDELGLQEDATSKTYQAVAAALLPSGLFEVWKESVFYINHNKTIIEVKKGY